MDRARMVGEAEREPVLVDRVGPVGILTLNRPRVLNAISSALLDELLEALSRLERDDSVRAVVLTGTGERAFSAGADIRETAGRTVEEAARAEETWSRGCWYLATYPKPTIGALNGLVYGGAALLASTLDVRIGCERTSFRFLYAAMGRIVGTWVLPHLVGWSRAKELLLTARVVDAEEAFRLGLLHRLAASDQLRDAAIATGEMIAANHPESVRGIKQLLQEQIGMGYEEMYRHEQEARRDRFVPTPFGEAFREFLDRKATESG